MNNSQKNSKSILGFFYQAERLKSTIRFSEEPEALRDSSAAHSWKLTLMVMIMADELKLEINVEKAIRMAIIHDLAESITGDIDHILIVQGKISKEDKRKAEEQAMNKIKKSLPKKIGQDIYDLWQEFEKGLTKEAKFVKALDKIEAMIRFLEGGHKVWHDNPESIPIHADKAVKYFPQLEGILRIIKQDMKKEFKKGGIPWEEKYNKFLT